MISMTLNYWNQYCNIIKRRTKPNNLFLLKPLSDKSKNYIKNSNSFMNIAMGSVRSTKTITSIIRFYKHIKENPYQDFAMAGKTMGSLRRNVVKPFLRLLDTYSVPYNYNKFENEIHLINQDKLITLFGIDKAGSEDIIKGFTCAGSLIDEATVMYPDGVRMLINRNSLPDAKIFITCNPSNPNNFLYQEYIINKKMIEKKKCTIYNFLLEDNLTLTPEYIENIKSMYPVDSVFYKRNILGLWVSGHGAIFDKLTDENFYDPDDQKDLNYYDYIEVGSDYGTSTTTCYSLIGIKEFKDHHEFDVICELGYDAMKEISSQTDSERVEDILQLQEENNLNKKNIFYCSHDAGSLKAALEKDKRIKMTIDTFKPDTLECIQELSTLFYKNYLRINKNCKETINQLKGYEWDSKASQNGIDRPIKKDDHYIDSLRAPIMNHLFKEDEVYSDLVYI